MNGKALRMRRILDVKSGKTVIVPMDHGVSLGPVKGISTITDSIRKVGLGGATCIVVHKGIASKLTKDVMGNMGLILHVSASTSLWNEPNRKAIVSSVMDAVKIGADAVSIHVNLGGKYENEMLAQMGDISSQCIEMGMPLLAMMYPRGENVKSQFDVEAVKNCARVGAELGADIVKTNYTGDVDSFSEVVKGCHVPVVIAGGPKMDSEEALLKMVREAMEAGAAGISIGRNVFQHEDITGITKKLAEIVFSY
ncbi:MAG: 2-amino-3,7-dideoxy-D-threo-hept-6-ulosonate synthase [Thermoplasmata archaeon]